MSRGLAQRSKHRIGHGLKTQGWRDSFRRLAAWDGRACGLIAAAPFGITLESTMQQSTCLSPACGKQTPYRAPLCPACGRQAFDDAELARRGWHVLQLGVILVVAMAAAAWMLSTNLAAALGGQLLGNPAATAGNARLVVIIFGAMLLMGVAVVVSGVQMIRARSSLWSTRLAIALFLTALLALGAFVLLAYFL